MPFESVSSISENTYITKDESNPNKKQERRPFKIHPPKDPTPEALMLDRATEDLKVLWEAGAINRETFGHALVNNYSHFLEKIGIGYRSHPKDPARPTRDQVAAIGKMNEFYKRIIDVEWFNQIQMGGKAEFAIMRELSRVANIISQKTKIPYSVLHSTPEEDLYNGVDGFIRNDLNGKLTAFQFKCLAINQKPQRLVHPIKNEHTLAETVDRIMDSTLFVTGKRDSREYGLQSEVRETLEFSGKNLLEFNDESDPNMQKAIIAVPNTVSKYAVFNETTGMPIGDDLYVQLYQDLTDRNNGLISLPQAAPTQHAVQSIAA